MASQDCFNWQKTGECKFGANCRFLHDDQETRGSIRKKSEFCRGFLNTGTCQFGDGCRYSHEKDVIEAEKKRQESAPARKEAPAGGKAGGKNQENRLDCFQYTQSGSCSFGANCQFLHGKEPTRGSSRKNAEVCYALQEKGSCKWGNSCRFSHDPQALAAAAAGGSAAAGAPKKKEVKECWKFRENGDCEFGDKCRFRHQAA